MNKKLIAIFIIISLLVIVICYNNNINNLNGEKIDYKIVYKGFITIQKSNQPLPPQGTFVFRSEKQWTKFSNKYFPQINSVIKMFDTINFSKKNIVYILTISPKAQYGLSDELESLVIVDNKLTAKYKSPNEHGVYALNDENLIHPFLIIAKIDKEDISNDLKNIYFPN